MIILKTTAEKFNILNLSDPQLNDSQWCNEASPERETLKTTVNELIKRVKPQLITISGDVAYGNHFDSYKHFADFIDTFGIPWAPIFGNHDNEAGEEAVLGAVDIFKAHKNCLFEDCDRALGIGNYVIGVEKNGKIIEGIILMDTHDRVPYTDQSGKTELVWDHLHRRQFDWYEQQISALKNMGCNDTVVITHIPIPTYRRAADAAFLPDINKDDVTLKQSYEGLCWQDGYKSSFGIQRESICSYPDEDGFFDLVKKLGSTKNIIAGHDHVNNTVIVFEGVRLIYSLKCGAGCYWDQKLNGGTALTVTDSGVSRVWHEYVDVSEMI